MQRLFRDGLLSGNATLGYSERVREFTRAVDGKAVGDPGQVLAEFVEGNVLALQNLGGHVGREALAEAVGLIARADTVYVAGVRRSFPVAAYLAYSLHQVDKKTRSEEHTSELQSLMRISYAVFCLKKKNKHVTRK